MLGRRFHRPRDQLFVTTPFALPRGENFVRIAGALINSAVRWNNLTTTTRTSTAARRAFFNVDLQQLSVVVQDELFTHPLTQVLLT